MMGEPAWKVGERENRKQYSLEKDAHIGEAGTDGIGEWLVVEYKLREKLPQWIEDALRQAEARAKPNQLAATRLHKKGRRRSEDWWVIRDKTMEDWFGGECQSAHQKAMLDMAKQRSSPPCYDEAYWEAMETMAKEESDV